MKRFNAFRGVVAGFLFLGFSLLTLNRKGMRLFMLFLVYRMITVLEMPNLRFGLKKLDSEMDLHCISVDTMEVMVLKPEKMNDEYCDCVDGADETTTNACSGREVVKKNKEMVCYDRIYKIPVSKVNDGICDCCDCSDEPARNYKHSVQNTFYNCSVKSA